MFLLNIVPISGTVFLSSECVHYLASQVLQHWRDSTSGETSVSGAGGMAIKSPTHLLTTCNCYNLDVWALAQSCGEYNEDLIFFEVL